MAQGGKKIIYFSASAEGLVQTINDAFLKDNSIVYQQCVQNEAYAPPPPVACSSDLSRSLNRLRGTGLVMKKLELGQQFFQCGCKGAMLYFNAFVLQMGDSTQQPKKPLLSGLRKRLGALPDEEFAKLSQIKVLWYMDYNSEHGPFFLDLKAMRAFSLSAFKAAIGGAGIVLDESNTMMQEEDVVLEEHHVGGSPIDPLDSIQLPSTFDDLKQAAHWAMLNYTTTDMAEVRLNHVLWPSNDVVPLNTQLATLLQYEQELVVRAGEVRDQTYKPDLALLQQLVDADMNMLRDDELVQLVDNIIPNPPTPDQIMAHTESVTLSTIMSLVHHQRTHLETILHITIESRAHEIALIAFRHLAIVNGATELAGALVSHLKALQGQETSYPFKCKDCQQPVLKLDFLVTSHCQQCQQRCAVCRIKTFHQQLAAPKNAHFLLPEAVAVLSDEARMAHQYTHEFIALANARCICDPTAVATTDHEMPAEATNLMETEGLAFFSPQGGLDVVDQFLNLDQ